MKGWPGSHTHKKRNFFLFCFLTQSGSIAMNYTSQCDTFGLIPGFVVVLEAFWNNGDVVSQTQTKQNVLS